MNWRIKSLIIHSCKYKHKYESMKEVLIKLLERRKQGILVDSCYRCVICGKYHMGHYPKTSKKRCRNRNSVRFVLKMKGEKEHVTY